MKNIKRITFELPPEEYDKFHEYCDNKQRTKAGILREFIRNLNKENKP